MTTNKNNPSGFRQEAIVAQTVVASPSDTAQSTNQIEHYHTQLDSSVAMEKKLNNLSKPDLESKYDSTVCTIQNLQKNQEISSSETILNLLMFYLFVLHREISPTHYFFRLYI